MDGRWLADNPTLQGHKEAQGYAVDAHIAYCYIRLCTTSFSCIVPHYVQGIVCSMQAALDLDTVIVQAFLFLSFFDISCSMYNRIYLFLSSLPLNAHEGAVMMQMSAGLNNSSFVSCTNHRMTRYNGQ